MFILGSNGDDINQYTLTSPFDTSTVDTITSYSVSSNESVPTSMMFSNDGKRLFVLESNGDDIDEYLLGSAYDLSALGFVGKVSIAGQETNPTGMTFNHDGSKLYVIGSTGDDINIYDLDENYRMTTGMTFVDSFSVAGQETVPTGLAFSDDGTQLFVIGSTGDDINVYNIDEGLVSNDIDGDGIINSLDLDSDNDGIGDNVEAQSTAGYVAPGSFTDVDGDGLNDIYDEDTSSIDAAASQGLSAVNSDMDDLEDYKDTDSDNDDKLDVAESGLGVYPGSTPTYDDPNGSLNDPSSQLQNTNATPEVDYREFDAANLIADGVLTSQSVVNHSGRATNSIRINLPTLTLIDNDGSESLLLNITGLDIGFTISDSLGNTFTATSGNTSIDISDWNTDVLYYRAPSNISTSTSFNITATSQEGANLAISGPTELVMNFNLTRFVPPQTCPIILDLDGDGVETLALAQGVTFDIDNDGNIDRTGWVGKDDGLLVLDVNNDGMINDGAELFGEEMLKADGTKAEDGFDALREFDTNNDGHFSSADDAFADVKIWKDENSDGISQQHELFSLIDAGVESIDLNATAVSEENQGNWTGLSSTWDDTQGESHAVDDVWFAFESGENKVLDLSDLLENHQVQMDSLDQYLHFEQQGDNLVVYIDENGGFTEDSYNKNNATDVVTLMNTNMSSTDYEDIMKELLDNNQLVIE